MSVSPPLFSNYLIADWSAAAAPKTGVDSIWYGWLERHADGHWTYEDSNPDTRAKAMAEIRARLVKAMQESRATLAGFDFPLGYPRGAAARMSREAEQPWRGAWKTLARRVFDGDENANNRFAAAGRMNRMMGAKSGPFWGRPANGDGFDGLTARKPAADAHGLPEMRIADSWQTGPQSPWKLYGAGSVGGQQLVGLPRLWRLHEDPAVAPHIKVWPFETGLAAPFGARADQPRIVLAEVWPSLARWQPYVRDGQVKDQAQVRALAEHLAKLDQAGRLARLFVGPRGLNKEQREAVEREEGWILGVV